MNKKNQIQKIILSLLIFFLTMTFLSAQTLSSLLSTLQGNNDSSSITTSNSSNTKTSTTNNSTTATLDSAISSNNITSLASNAFVASPQLAMSNENYMVTAGDVYSLNYAAGTTPVSYSILVDPSYKIRVSNMAVLDATGKTFVTLKNEVEQIVTKNYPMSGVQFVLLKPSSFTVTIKGEVIQTTEENAWALSRLSSVVGNILTDYSSIRSITITSSSGRSKTYDLFKALRNGDMSQDPYVRPGDVISVQKVSKKVTIAGAVERPGTYELLPNENILSLINIYGAGKSERADLNRVELVRVTEGSNVSGEKLFLTEELITDSFQLNNLDSVFIPTYADLKPVMFFEGAIYAAEGTTLNSSTRVSVQFNYGESYDSLIRSKRSFFSATSDTESSYIIRNGEYIPLDINTILYDTAFSSKLEVQPYDIVMVPFKQYFVTVAGSVVAPGRYPYIPDRDWEYYIGLAGGFDKTRNSGDSIVIRESDGTKIKKDDVITPETTITAKTNSFLYFFNQYAPLITTLLSVITTSITLLNIAK